MTRRHGDRERRPRRGAAGRGNRGTAQRPQRHLRARGAACPQHGQLGAPPPHQQLAAEQHDHHGDHGEADREQPQHGAGRRVGGHEVREHPGYR